jgi:superfamily II DNA/RNA helicase
LVEDLTQREFEDMEHKSYRKFEDFELSRKLQDAVYEARLERPTELQIEVIPQALAERDVIFEARSGMGKSACFAIPFLQHWLRDRTRKGMIITPTAAAVQQLGKVISRLCPALKAKVLKFTSRDDYFYPELHDKCPLVILEYDVAARFIKREKEFVANVHSLGLDDLDQMLDKEAELEELVQALSADRQTLISAGELTEQIIEKGRWFCDSNKMVKVRLFRPEANWDKDQIQLRYLMVNEENRASNLIDLLEANKDQVVMIITDSDRISREVVEMLGEHEMEGHVLAYSMQLDEKQAIANQVVEKGHGVLVGCEAAMNGLNLPKVDHLMSWELPSDLEQYWKRVDRFIFQVPLLVTVMVDEPRAGAVRILERRLGRSMTWLNEEAGAPAPRGGRFDRRDDRRDDRRPEQRSEQRSESRPESRSERPRREPVNAARPSPRPSDKPEEPVVPTRFNMPVAAEPDDLAKYAPNGKIHKSLGSKFIPAGKKKSPPAKPAKDE